MRMLVVEDEAKAAAYLRKGLFEADFVVDVARRGDEGLQQAQTGHYDLIILDIMLPGLKGWDILKSMRERGQQTPVLFLTAKDSVEERVRGLAPMTTSLSPSRFRSYWLAFDRCCVERQTEARKQFKSEI